MNRLTTLVVSLVLLAHSLAGCCNHHAHAVEAETSAACCHVHGRGVELEGPGHEGHEHDGHANNDSTPDTDHDAPADGCSEGTCVFLRSDGPASLVLNAALTVRFALPQVELMQRPHQIACVLTLDSDSAAPPLRLHLLHQILLI